WVHDEFAMGISSVAAGIADASGEVVAAVHVHGPSYRFPPAGREAALGLVVATSAARIARALRQAVGCRPFRPAARPRSVELDDASVARRCGLRQADHEGRAAAGL